MAGIGTANLIGGISSRNAGTPRYGALLICILTLPFAVATVLSPIPFLFLVGLQTPLYTAGMRCFWPADLGCHVSSSFRCLCYLRTAR
jgi:diguanylate cyclase